MTLFATPGQIFTSVSQGFATGLTGTIGVRIENSDGTNQTPRTISGIVEIEPASGVYAKNNLLAPNTAGNYVVLWDSGGGSPVFSSEALVVSGVLPTVATPSGSDLTTLGNVRAFLQKGGGDTAQDPIVQSMITRASQSIMRYCEREFAPATASTTRTFYLDNPPNTYGVMVLDLAPYDLRSVTQIQIDTDESSPTTLTTDQFRLWPKPAPDGTYLQVHFSLLAQGRGRWTKRQLDITGAWGFSAIPAEVEQAAIATVATWLRRDIAAFESTFSIDEARLERPQEIPAAARAALDRYCRMVLA